MSVDPSHYLPSTNGGKPPLLKLQNISARPELNGQFGQAVSFSAGRYVVAILDATTAAAAVMGGGAGGSATAPQPTMLKLKPENLTEAGSIDQLKFGASMAYQSAKAYVGSQNMEEWGETIIAKLPPSLQPKLTPKQALIGAAIVVQVFILALYLLIGRFVGFSKIFVFLSLIGLFLAVSSPDWMEGYKANKPISLLAKSAIRNFPMRWKQNLVTMTGYHNISDKMALASLVIVLLFSAKLLLTPAPTPTSRISMMGDNNNLQRMPNRAPQYDLEYIYKLGFDDASSGKDFGTSLPEDIIKYNAAQEDGSIPPMQQNQYADTNYDDWVPPPPPKSKSSLGMGTMLSMFTLYRFGKDIVTSPDGTLVLDPQYIMARVRSIEPWRLGIMGMSLYRVVTALSSFFR